MTIDVTLKQLTLTESQQAWPSERFNAVLKSELEAMSPDQLPLQQGLRVSSYAMDEAPAVMILSVKDVGEDVQVNIGVFFRGMVPGCSCADDPTPVEPVNEYGEWTLRMNKQTGIAALSPVE
jgi:hypothetical protein